MSLIRRLLGIPTLPRTGGWRAAVLYTAHLPRLGVQALAGLGLAQLLEAAAIPGWARAPLALALAIEVLAEVAASAAHHAWEAGRLWPDLRCAHCDEGPGDGPDDDDPNGGPDDPEDHGRDWDAAWIAYQTRQSGGAR